MTSNRAALRQDHAATWFEYVKVTNDDAGEAMPDREILGTLFGYLWNPEHGFRGRLAGAMGLLLASKVLNITVNYASNMSQEPNMLQVLEGNQRTLTGRRLPSGRPSCKCL
jgi:hypothetical protein